MTQRSRRPPGFAISAVSYLEALESRPKLTRECIDTVYKKVDVLHAPVMVSVPTIAETTPVPTM